MAHRSPHRLNVATVPGPVITTNMLIKQPARPNLAKTVQPVANKTQRYYLNDSRLSIIAEQSRLHNGTELTEVTSAAGQPDINDMALVLVSYGYEPLRFKACQRAIDRLDRANPKPGKKIFIEASKDTLHFEYLKERGWEYQSFVLTDQSEGIFQKEPLWTIGTKLAFQDESINKVVLVDADCAFHDNSWPHLINKSLSQYEFVQPFAAILYSEQKDYSETVPSIAYCIHTNQQHWLAVPGGAYACTRSFFFDILGGAWPTNAVGAGDDEFWKYLYGHTPIVSSKEMKELAPVGKFYNFKVGYTAMLLNHYYHGPMSNRMYRTRQYISARCINGSETTYRKDGILEWSTNSVGRIMKRSMAELKKNTNAYLQVARQFTVGDTKAMYKKICQEEMGKIDENHPLLIVTVYRKHGVYTQDQIRKLKESVQHTFKCPYTFKVVTDTKYAYPEDEMIYCDLPSRHIPPGYEWIMATSIDAPSNTSILYLDPGVRLEGTCSMVPCSDDEIFLARRGREWSMRLMYFKSLTSIYHEFKDDMLHYEYLPGRLYPSSANYFIHALTEMTAYKLRDILFHLDYESGKVTEKTTNFTI